MSSHFNYQLSNISLVAAIALFTISILTGMVFRFSETWQFVMSVAAITTALLILLPHRTDKER
jgi:low affinity Fe/Cu permease